MAKMTNKQLEKLLYIQDLLIRANAKLYSDDYKIVRSLDNIAINKFCGSEFCFYDDVLKKLDNFILSNTEVK